MPVLPKTERDGERSPCTQAEGGSCPSDVVAVLFMLLDFF